MLFKYLTGCNYNIFFFFIKHFNNKLKGLFNVKTVNYNYLTYGQKL